MAILPAIMVLGGIGAVGALALNTIARRFHVDEDERISLVEDLLPGANCGACGCNGCYDFAVRCINAGSLDGFYCPSAGEAGMSKISSLLGWTAEARQPNVAVLMCGGTPESKTPLPARYVGPHSCAIMNMTAGSYECVNSCLGCGDCTKVCRWDAIKVDPATNTVVIDADRCTGCGMCVTNCPRHVLSLRPKGPKNRRVWVACSNCLKGADARKQCKVSCIACGLCVKTCPFEAIEIKANHAHINPAKCKTCGKCIPVCPTHAIKSVNVVIRQNNEAANV